MGKSKDSGIVFGTRGSYSVGLFENNAENKALKLARDDLVRPLIDAGVKFNREDVIFLTWDKTGQLLWLENGNSNRGLQHILFGDKYSKGHIEDFQKKFNVKKEDVAKFINDFVTNGKLMYSVLKKRGEKTGYERLYKKGRNYFLLVGLGTNGYIVSAYPIDEEKALKLIRRYKRWKKK